MPNIITFLTLEELSILLGISPEQIRFSLEQKSYLKEFYPAYKWAEHEELSGKLIGFYVPNTHINEMTANELGNEFSGKNLPQLQDYELIISRLIHRLVAKREFVSAAIRKNKLDEMNKNQLSLI